MLRRIRSFYSANVQRHELEAGMNEEIRFHIEEHTARLMREGMSERDARRRARMDFGSTPATMEACRESRGLDVVDELRRNVTYALRLLRRSPGFSATAILTLALGIGANTAIFSVIDAVLLRPLPFPRPERLVRVLNENFSPDGAATGINESQDGIAWEYLNRMDTGADYAASGYGDSLAVARDGRAEYVPAQRVTAGYFRVLGVRFPMGREFTAEEDTPNGAPVAILSHDLWKRYFQGSAGAVGSTIHLRGEPHTVVGVAPEGLSAFGPARLWTPLRVTRTGEGSGTNYFMFGRLREGVSSEQAGQRILAISPALIKERQYPKDGNARLIVVPLQEGIVGNNRTPLLAIWAAVGMVLLIACVNVAGLLLARSEARAREVATRAALGGGTPAVLRQLVTESVVLALLGGLAGVVLAYGGIRLLSLFVTEELGIWQNVSLDARVLGLSALVTLGTGVLFGLVPAFETVKVNLRDALAAGGTRAVAGGTRHWPRKVLVAAEVGLCLVLLIGAGLLIRTFQNIYDLPPGFDGTNVVTTSVSLNDVRYADAGRANRYFAQTLEKIRAVPGVENAAVGLHVPYDRWLNLGVRVPGVASGGDESLYTTMNYVTAGYFETLRIPIRAGRAIGERDIEGAAPVVLVNETFVKRYLEGKNPVGLGLSLGGEKSLRTIVGVAGDVQQTPGLSGGAPFLPEPAIYIPSRQLTGLLTMVHTWFSPKWVIRGQGDPRALEPEIQRVFAAADPLLPTTTFRPVEAYRGERLGFERARLVLLSALAALALVLGAVGVYGLVSHQVNDRTREMGIRLALGASRSRAIGSAALPGVGLTVAGLLLGAVLAVASSRYLESRLFGVTPTDPLTFLVAALFLLGVATVASLLPAMRLLRLNPARTLRAE